jgi:hypothetical protein
MRTASLIQNKEMKTTQKTHPSFFVFYNTALLVPCIIMMFLLRLLFLLQTLSYASCWTYSLQRKPFLHILQSQKTSQQSQQPTKIMDADFEPVNNRDDNQSEEQLPVHFSNQKSLLELFIEADPEFNATRIPFIDSDDTYIDARLAFLTELDGVRYAIAVPFDHTAAITIEELVDENEGDIQVTNVDPSLDENQELMELMAAQLQEQLGDAYRLRRTPRILTISGPLEEYSSNWQRDLLPPPTPAEALMEDEEEAFFHAFMKQELGEELYAETMQDDGAPSIIDDDVMELFNVPGLGTQETDEDGMTELYESIFLPPDEQTRSLREFAKGDLDHDGVALKLISYVMEDKAYSLVHLLKPYVLIARVASNPDEQVRFELLGKQEEKLLIPRLEAVCKADLEAKGLELSL